MSRAGRSNAGFTLLELLAVLVIIALVAAQVAPGLAALSGFHAARTADAVEAALARAQEQAIRGARTVILRPSMFEAQLTSGMRLTGAALSFYPHGGSSGGQWALRTGEDEFFYEIDWLTGQVTRHAFQTD